MADLSDVETAIVNTLAGLVYPTGSSNPSAVLNDAGQPMPVRLYRGWPIAAALDADLAAGTVNISVQTRNGTEKNTTRFHPDYQTVTLEAATVAAAVNALNRVVITGGGAAGIVQWVTVLVGTRVVVAYNVLAADTPTTIAAALAAALTAAGVPATSSVGTISLTGSAPYLAAQVGVTGTQAAEWRRQETQVQITMWCPTPVVRDNAAKLLEPTLAKTTFLTMPDQFQARFRYHNTIQFDGGEKVALYRRDLVYSAEYATTDLDTGWQVTAADTNVQGGPGNLGTAPVTVNLPPVTVNVAQTGPVTDWTKIQVKQDITGSGTSKAVTLTSAVSNNSIVVGSVLLVGGALLQSVTDDKGNIYVLTGQGDNYAGNSTNGFRSLGLITNGPQTLTFHYQSSGIVWIDIAEFAPPTGTTAISLDGCGMLLGSALATTPNVRVRNNDVLLYSSSFSTGVSTTGAGWTASAGSGTAQCSEWKIQATPSDTVNATYATQTGSTWAICIGIAPVARTGWEMRQCQITRGNNAVSTGSVVLPNPVAAGNIVVGSIAVGTPSGPTLAAGLTSFVDDKGNSYSLVPGTLGNTVGDRQIFWSGGKLNNGPQTITANFNASEGIIYFLVGEFIPPPGAASISVDAGVNVNSTTAPTTTPNITTSKAHDLLYTFGDHAAQGTVIVNGFNGMNGGQNTDTFSHAWLDVPVASTVINAQWTDNTPSNTNTNSSLAAFSVA